jgi:hypothetical protein
VVTRADSAAVDSAVPMLPKVPAMLFFRPVSAVTRATAIRAAIRPYSMAVAPDSSVRKRETNLVIAQSPSLVSEQLIEGSSR